MEGQFMQVLSQYSTSSEKWVETSSFSDSGGRLYMGWVDAFNEESLECEKWKRLFDLDFTQPLSKSRYCDALWVA
jgi:hypothetical protein